MKKTIFTICILFIALIGYGQDISGKVTDPNGQSLPGVSVTVKGTTRGAITNTSGDYSVEAKKGDVLVFSFIGMIAQSVSVGNQKVVNIVLQEDSQQLGEVVVTALGISREKRSLGYSTQEVSSKEINEIPETNIVNALQGRIAGAQISRQGGAPGQGSQIILRGINSLNPGADNQPLFIVDGVPISNDIFTVGGGDGRGATNRAADIDLNDVESVNVLKGGAATALYGVRAANGAIIISTKKGKNGKTVFNITSTVGSDEINKIPNTQREYTQGYSNEYDKNSFWPTWGPTVAEAQALDSNHPSELYNNFEQGYQRGSQFNLHLDASGGTENTSFFSSFSKFDQTGIVPFTDYGKMSGKVNGTIKLSNKFTMLASANFINSGGLRTDASAFNTRLVYWAPQKDVSDFEYSEGPLKGTMKPYRPEIATGNNPIYGNKTNTFKDNVNRLIGNIGFNFQPISGMDISYRFGMDYFADSRKASAPGPSGIEGEAIFEDNGLGFITETRIASRDLTNNLVVSYERDLNEDFDMTLRAGVDAFERSYDRVSTTGTQFEVWDFIHLSNAANITTSQFLSKRRLVGLYGEASFSFRDMLYLTVTDRNDWSSTLPQGNNSFNYPSVSMGYIFTDMIAAKPNWFEYGKLRASYAQIGKDAIGAYLTSDVYGANAPGFPIGDVTGWTRPNNKADLNLLNEQTTEIEIGTELRFLKNRLTLDASWYKSNAMNQILGVPVANTSGYSTFTTNSGEIQNSGIELLLNAAIIENSNFKWNFTANFTNNNNKVISIKDGIDNIYIGEDYGYNGGSALQILYPGYSYGNLLGTSYKRYYENPADEDPLVIDKSRPIVIGSDGFPVRELEPKILGNSIAKWFANFGNRFTYKNFALGFNIDVRQGFQKFNSLDNFLAAFGMSDYSTNRNETIVFEGVTANGEPNTKEVYLGQGNGPDGVNYGAGFYRNVYRGVAENFVEDASWVRLQNLNVSYSLPQSVLEKSPIKNVLLSLTGTNLWLSTPYSGFDPEVSVSTGNDQGFAGRGAYPGLKSYAATLRLTF
ncbi:TonB-linked outer membrane protein, SusC/RagA family [Spirosomataceae bacterium TFI 002]|nr:TonB-linked outer membrane protein, SusC/RagA family [Spirosomataceae bacterium TFI 002]